MSEVRPNLSIWLVLCCGLYGCSTRTFLLDDRPEPQRDAGTLTPSSDAGDAAIKAIETAHSLPPELVGKDLSYYQHAKAVLDARCVGCHRGDGFGPFALDSYDTASSRASAIEEVMVKESMPPFLPDTENCRALLDVRDMPESERAVLEAWVQQGAKPGASDNRSELTVELPTGRLEGATRTLPLATPSTSAPSQLPAHRCFVVDPGLTVDTSFVGFFVQATNQRALRRALVHLALPGNELSLGALEAVDPEPGYACFYGAGFSGAITVSDWVVGQDRFGFPDQTLLTLPAGSRFVVELDELAERGPAAPSLLLYGTEGTTERSPSSMYVVNTDFVIPANVEGVSESAQGSFVAQDITPTPVGQAREGKIWGASALMHLRGKSARLTLVRRSGERECLLDLPRFDLAWAGGYRFAEPLAAKAGDRIELRCTWDNSAQNQPIVDGKVIASQELRYGPSVLDETCVGTVIVSR